MKIKYAAMALVASLVTSVAFAGDATTAPAQNNNNNNAVNQVAASDVQNNAVEIQGQAPADSAPVSDAAAPANGNGQAQ